MFHKNLNLNLTSAKKAELEEIKKVIEICTNTMLKIIIDYT